MERGESIIDLPQLPISLSEERAKRRMRREEWPTEDDWKAVQGGKPLIIRTQEEWNNVVSFNKPKLKFDDTKCYVVHNYINKRDPSGTGMIIDTFYSDANSWNNPVSYRDNKEKTVGFPAGLLWDRHGKPCQGKGQKYERMDVKS